MRETDATYLIKTVFDYFLEKSFKKAVSQSEYQMSLFCFEDFVKDREPYWVRIKAQHVIAHILYYTEEHGEPPEHIKDVVLTIAKQVRKELSEQIAEEMLESGSTTVSHDIDAPDFITFQSWGRLSWDRPRPPLKR
jgi:hypothetical protein